MWATRGLPASDMWVGCVDRYPGKHQTGHMTTAAQAAPSFRVVAPNSGTSGMFKSRINGALSWLSIRIVEQENQAPPGGGHDHNSPHCQPFIRKRGI
jgi:hypothetical protein